MSRRARFASSPAEGPRAGIALPSVPAVASTRVAAWSLFSLSLGLAVAWTLAPGALRTASAFLVGVGLTGLVMARERHAVPLAALTVVTFGVFAFTPGLPLAYDHRLRFESAAALLPLAALMVLARVARGRAPLVAVVVLASLGSLIRLLEAWWLFGRPGDAATIEHALRFDAAASLWGAAAWAVVFTLAARGLVRGRSRRSHRQAVWAFAAVGFLSVATGGPVLLEAGAMPVPGLDVGFHAMHVADVPPGATVVHLEAAMPRINPEPGAWRFDELDAEIEAAAARGLDVYLLVSTYPPRWLQQAFPESIMVDADGDVFDWIDEAPGSTHRRVWDMSFADDRVLDAKRVHVENVVARYGTHPAVRWVAVQNEPAYPVGWNLLRWASFDATTVAAFRAALHEEAGGDLDALNEAYGTDFASWEEVVPPRVPFGRLGDRWMELREGWLVHHTTSLMDAARLHTTKPVTTKLMAHFLTRFAEPQAGLSDATYRALAQASDVVSIDLYPVTRADLVRQLEYFTAISEGKPIVVAEFNLALGTRLPFAGTRMLGALETIGRHAEAVILFTASGHFLYGIEPDSGAVAAARLARLGFMDGSDYASAVGDLWRDEIKELARTPWRAREALAFFH